MSTPTPSRWTWRLIGMCAVAAVAVSTAYLPQPLLTELADSLGVSTTIVGALATAVQGGYALGIFLLVPLADKAPPRRQVTLQAVALAGLLALTAALPTFLAVAAGFFAVGLVANIAQLIIPTAARLSPPERRGATASALVGSLVIGIFGGRVLAGLLAEALGWRGSVLAFAGLVAVAAVISYRVMPVHLELNGQRSYAQLLRGTVTLVVANATLRWVAVSQALAFAAFNSLWTVVVVHLTAEPFGWSVTAASLFGLIGLAAGAVTPFAGRFIDRFGPVRVAVVLTLALMISAATVILDGRNALIFGVSMFLVTLANQSMQSANQFRAMAASPDRSAQANTAFMTLVFTGGALGALVGSTVYGAAGMPALGAAAVVFIIISAAALWRSAAHVEPRPSAAPSERTPS